MQSCSKAAINTLIDDDPYPLLNLNLLLRSLKGFKWFTLVDLNWGFWKIKLTESAQKYTGFCIPDRGIFKWTVMPFGLETSPTIFQRAIEIALRPLLNAGKTKVYIDNIIIGGITVEESIEETKKVFEAFRRAGFFINLAKAKFLRRETLILG